MQSETLFRSGRGATMLGALALIACGLFAGCGGSSKASGGPEEKFLGRWELDSASSTFAISCGTVLASPNAALWIELLFERGVLTDVSETSGTCLSPGLAFDVGPQSALSLSNPDPYTGMASVCAVSLGSGAVLELDFSTLTFTLLAAAGSQPEAPRGLLGGVATGAIFQDDGTGTIVQSATCTYSGTGDTFHRMSQP